MGASCDNLQGGGGAGISGEKSPLPPSETRGSRKGESLPRSAGIGNGDTKGSDPFWLDLLLELPGPIANPALLAAQVSAQVSRLVDGRKVAVVLAAPNLLRLPIHEVALKEGQPL